MLSRRSSKEKLLTRFDSARRDTLSQSKAGRRTLKGPPRECLASPTPFRLQRTSSLLFRPGSQPQPEDTVRSELEQMKRTQTLSNANGKPEYVRQ